MGETVKYNLNNKVLTIDISYYGNLAIFIDIKYVISMVTNVKILTITFIQGELWK